jgi:hypothetical protein
MLFYTHSPIGLINLAVSDRSEQAISVEKKRKYRLHATCHVTRPRILARLLIVAFTACSYACMPICARSNMPYSLTV